MSIESEFQRYFGKLSIGVVLLDGDYSICECNSEFRELVDCAEPVGTPFVRFLAKEAQTAATERFAEVVRGDDGGVPVDALLAGEADRSVSLYAAPLNDEGGKVARILLHLVETTDQKRLEARFAQSQKMQAVGQLAGGIAHDFNNLLTAMIGFCDLLLQRYRPGEQAFADVIQIKQNANRGASLVRQLLAFSRQQTLKPQRLQMADVLAELSNLLRRLLGETIELKMVHGRDLGAVKVDQG